VRSFVLLCVQTEPLAKSVAPWRFWKHFPSVFLLTSEWMTALILWSRGQVWWWQLSFNNVGDAICRRIPAVMKEIKLHSKRLHFVLSRCALQLGEASVCCVCCSRRQCNHRSSPDWVFQNYGFLCSKPVLTILYILSRLYSSVTNNNGFWIGWLDLLTNSCTMSLNYNQLQ
jgi:hypothetical protein